LSRRLAIALSLLPLAGCDQWSGGSFVPFTKVSGERALAGETQRLVVTARVGDVLICPSSAGPVRIEAEVLVRSKRVEVEKAGKTFEDHVRISERAGVLTIEDAHRDAPDREDWSVALKVEMPRPLAVTAVTGVGNVEVRTAVGEVKAQTGVGDVRLSAGDLASAAVTSGTGNVEVKVGTISGSLEAASGVGGVTAKAAGVAGRTVAKTGTGDIDLEFAEASPREDVSATTGVGDVRVTLPAKASGRFSAQASVGQIEVEGLAGLAVTKSIPGESASGTVGEGGPQFTISTGTGDVTVRAGR
jgi:DUF4097 and DUF4098 domain-containing protein YvlB